MDTFHLQDCWILLPPLNPKANWQSKEEVCSEAKQRPRDAAPPASVSPLMSLFPSPSCRPAPSPTSGVCPQNPYKQAQQMMLQFLHFSPSCQRCPDIEEGDISARSSAGWGFTEQNHNLKLQTAILRQIMGPSTSEAVQDIRVNLWLRPIYLEQHWRVTWPFL